MIRQADSLNQPATPEAAGFVRAHEAPERHSAATVIAHADGWWPTGFAQEELPRPMATVSFNNPPALRGSCLIK